MTTEKNITLINAILEANINGQLPREFSASDVRKVCPGWMDGWMYNTYGSTLSHYTRYEDAPLKRVARGLYRIK